MDADAALEAIREMLHGYSIDLPKNAKPEQIVGAVQYIADKYDEIRHQNFLLRTAQRKK